MMRTGINAKQIHGTFLTAVQWFGKVVFPFRVGTPPAGEGTPFKKYQGTASWAIMNRKALDVKQCPG